MPIGIMGSPCPVCGCSLYIRFSTNTEVVYCRNCNTSYAREFAIPSAETDAAKKQAQIPSVEKIKKEIEDLKSKELRLLEDVLLTRSSVNARLSHSELMALDIMKRINFLNKVASAQALAEDRNVEEQPPVTLKTVEKEINKSRAQELEELISTLQEHEKANSSSGQVTSEMLELIEKIAALQRKINASAGLTEFQPKRGYFYFPEIHVKPFDHRLNLSLLAPRLKTEQSIDQAQQSQTEEDTDMKVKRNQIVNDGPDYGTSMTVAACGWTTNKEKIQSGNMSMVSSLEMLEKEIAGLNGELLIRSHVISKSGYSPELDARYVELSSMLHGAQAKAKVLKDKLHKQDQAKERGEVKTTTDASTAELQKTAKMSDSKLNEMRDEEIRLLNEVFSDHLKLATRPYPSDFSLLNLRSRMAEETSNQVNDFQQPQDQPEEGNEMKKEKIEATSQASELSPAKQAGEMKSAQPASDASLLVKITEKATTALEKEVEALGLKELDLHRKLLQRYQELVAKGLPLEGDTEYALIAGEIVATRNSAELINLKVKAAKEASGEATEQPLGKQAGEVKNIQASDDPSVLIKMEQELKSLEVKEANLRHRCIQRDAELKTKGNSIAEDAEYLAIVGEIIAVRNSIGLLSLKVNDAKEAKGTDLEFTALGSITMSMLSIIEQQISILNKKKLFPEMNFSWEEEALCRALLPVSFLQHPAGPIPSGQWGVMQSPPVAQSGFPQPHLNPRVEGNSAQTPTRTHVLTEEFVKARILSRFGDNEEGAKYLQCFALLYKTMEDFVKEVAKDKIKKAIE